MTSPASIANPFPLGVRVATGNPPPTVPSRPLAAVGPQAWGGVRAAPQPQVVAAQLAAGVPGTYNIGGTLVTVAGTSVGVGGSSVGGYTVGGTSVGGSAFNIAFPPGTDLTEILAAIAAQVGAGGVGGGCGGC